VEDVVPRKRRAHFDERHVGPEQRHLDPSPQPDWAALQLVQTSPPTLQKTPQYQPNVGGCTWTVARGRSFRIKRLGLKAVDGSGAMHEHGRLLSNAEERGTLAAANQGKNRSPTPTMHALTPASLLNLPQVNCTMQAVPTPPTQPNKGRSASLRQHTYHKLSQARFYFLFFTN
jgi:hypothetical protein